MVKVVSDIFDYLNKEKDKEFKSLERKYNTDLNVLERKAENVIINNIPLFSKYNILQNEIAKRINKLYNNGEKISKKKLDRLTSSLFDNPKNMNKGALRMLAEVIKEKSGVDFQRFELNADKAKYLDEYREYVSNLSDVRLFNLNFKTEVSIFNSISPFCSKCNKFNQLKEEGASKGYRYKRNESFVLVKLLASKMNNVPDKRTLIRDPNNEIKAKDTTSTTEQVK